VIGRRQELPNSYFPSRPVVAPWGHRHSRSPTHVCSCSLGEHLKEYKSDQIKKAVWAHANGRCPHPHSHPHLHSGRIDLVRDCTPITCDPTTEPTPTPPPYSPTTTTAGLRPPTRLGLQYLEEYLAESYPGGIPQDTHETEWTDYFAKPVANTGHPTDPAYWRELDRQVRVKFPHPDPRIEKRTKAVTAIRQATERRRQQQYKKPRLDAPKAEVASDPETPRRTPLQARRKRTRNIRRRRQQARQVREDLGDINGDPFRQAGLNQNNSADAPYAAIEWQELVKRYPEWYKD